MKKLIIFILAIAIFPQSAFAENMQERICARVVKNFADDAKMWERVNNRIENRFGYRCSKQKESSSYSSSPTSSSSSSSRTISTKKDYLRPVSSSASTSDDDLYFKPLCKLGIEFVDKMIENLQSGLIQEPIYGLILNLLKEIVDDNKAVCNLAIIEEYEHITGLDLNYGIELTDRISDRINTITSYLEINASY